MEREIKNPVPKNINLRVPFDFKSDLNLSQKNRFVSLKQVDLGQGANSADRIDSGAEHRSRAKFGNKSNPKNTAHRKSSGEEPARNIVSFANFSFGDEKKNKKRFSQVLKLDIHKIQKSRIPEQTGSIRKKWKGPRYKKCRSSRVSRTSRAHDKRHFFRELVLESSFDGSCKSETIENGSLLNLKETAIGSSDLTLKENLARGWRAAKGKGGVYVDENKTIKRRPNRRKLRRISRSKSQNIDMKMQNFKKYFLDLPEEKKLGKTEILEIINQYF